MDKQQISIKLTLDALGLDLNMTKFQDRLIFQKAIYMAQAGGVKLGYFFGWYLHGPYCSALTSDGFSTAAELDDDQNESKGWMLVLCP